MSVFVPELGTALFAEVSESVTVGEESQFEEARPSRTQCLFL